MATDSSQSPVPTDSGVTPVVRAEERFTDEQLASIGSFTDAMNLLSEEGFIPEDFAATYGTGFRVLTTEEKARLIGVPFVIMEWAFNDATKGGERFVSCAIVTEPGEKLILNDGSSGIMQQLEAVTASRVQRGATPTQAFKGLGVKLGLRRSEYPIGADGKPLTRDELRDSPELAKGTGSTFYLHN